jgi:putative two-component system response regulator
MNQAPQVTSRFEPAAADQMEKIVSDLGRMYQERNEALQEVARAHHEALFRLSVAAEYKDDDTGEHIVRIGFCRDAGAAYGKSKACTDAAQGRTDARHRQDRHSDSVLRSRAITPDERQTMNRHPAIGASILGKSRIELFQLASEIAQRTTNAGTARVIEPTGRRGHSRRAIVAVVDFTMP